MPLKKVNFIRNNLITWQNAIGVFKSQLLVEFGKYPTDKHLPQVQQLVSAIIEVTKFESWVLEKLQQYANGETEIDQAQITADLQELNQKLWLFVMPYKNQKAKDQFANSTSLTDYK